MRADPSCPRCGGPLHTPGLWSSEWQCDQHGAVAPFQPPVQPSAEALRQIGSTSRVPLWSPWPLPKGWLVTGLAQAGDERTGARATVVACTGPAPLGGIDGPDPGAVPLDQPAHAKVHAAGHPTAMWALTDVSDRAVYVGEALGCWLWAVLWPETAGFLLIDEFVLTDLRDASLELEMPFGALSPRLGG